MLTTPDNLLFLHLLVEQLKNNFDAPVANEIILLYPEVSTCLYISLWYNSCYFLSSLLL